MKNYLRRGAIAGAAGGAASALVLLLVGERTISRAIALEHAGAAARGEAIEEMFSRRVQLAGGTIGIILAGVAFGLILAVVFVAVRHRLAARDDWRRAVTLSVVAFSTVYLVPWLKYPANPPTVGDPETINERTALYFVLVAWSVVATWAGWRLLRWLRAKGYAEHLHLTAAVTATVAIVAVGFAVLPGSPDPIETPATLVWRFRLASLAGAATFWAVTGASFGWLCLGAGAGQRGRVSSATAINRHSTTSASSPPPMP